MLVDSHCHLNYEGLREDVDGVLSRARNAGVGYLLTINTRLAEADEVCAIAETHPGVFASVGVHPHEAEKNGVRVPDAILAHLDHPLVVGIGETGLDYYYEHAPRAAQRESFAAHIAASQESGLPLIVHTREAEDDTIAMLTAAMKEREFPLLIHCFTGTRRLMKEMVAIGAFISISGIVTFKNARDLQETAKEIPNERLLVETDAPYLAPVPHRGKRCEPAYVADTARFLAELRGVPMAALARTTSENFFRLFTRAAAARDDGHRPPEVSALPMSIAGEPG
ncbi:MAG: TatD family deoxyribonuclease [Alphaproteobacteria bacterium]|nr:MAG: TatD family deoxyribonuclease [Alphaproteobacteria bacterium]